MWGGNWGGAFIPSSDAGAGCPTVSEIWAHALPNGKSARHALMEASELLNEQIQGPYTMADILRILAAVAAGETTIVNLGNGQATVTFQAIDGSGPIVVGEMQDSDRVSVTLTPTEST